MTESTDRQIAGVIYEYGLAFRNDWSDVDGRWVQDNLDSIASWVSDHSKYPGDEVARRVLDLCPSGRGHWLGNCYGECGSGDGV